MLTLISTLNSSLRKIVVIQKRQKRKNQISKPIISVVSSKAEIKYPDRTVFNVSYGFSDESIVVENKK